MEFNWRISNSRLFFYGNNSKSKRTNWHRLKSVRSARSVKEPGRAGLGWDGTSRVEVAQSYTVNPLSAPGTALKGARPASRINKSLSLNETAKEAGWLNGRIARPGCDWKDDGRHYARSLHWAQLLKLNFCLAANSFSPYTFLFGRQLVPSSQSIPSIRIASPSPFLLPPAKRILPYTLCRYSRARL